MTLPINIRGMTEADTQLVSEIVAANYRLLAERDGFTSEQLYRLLTERCTVDYIGNAWFPRWDCYVVESEQCILGVIAIDADEIADSGSPRGAIARE